MKLSAFKALLQQHSDKSLRMVLPDGDPIPADFHVTEVGHVARNFIDCGGTVRLVESCLLQTWVADDDKEHRLSAGKLAKILDLGKKILTSEDLDVEVEYDCCVVAQYTVSSFIVDRNVLTFTLGKKRTDCLAREACGLEPQGVGCGCGDTSGKCC